MEGRVGAGARSPGREGEPVEENSAADHPAVRARPYLGLAAPGRSEVVIKKSRFLGYARPVETAAEAEEYIAALREDHREARHVCFAYRVGLEREEVRSSDDGEPSGTAGKPILEVLLQKDIRGAVVAVVRYFGGVLLGAPGLVRAYSQAAAEAVDEAGVVEHVPHVRATLTLPYGQLGKVRYLLGEVGGQEEAAHYGEDVRLTVLVPGRAWPSLRKQLEPFGGQLQLDAEPAVHYRAQVDS